jgi:hypothetical protein
MKNSATTLISPHTGFFQENIRRHNLFRSKKNLFFRFGAFGLIGRRRFGGFFLIESVFSAEAFDASRRINQLLAAGKKRVAIGTDFDLKILHRGTRFYNIAARAGDGRVEIFRMNFVFHFLSILYSNSYLPIQSNHKYNHPVPLSQEKSTRPFLSAPCGALLKTSFDFI